MIKYVIQNFYPNIHTYLVFLVGIYLAISKRKEYPQVSICIIGAIGVSFIAILINQMFTAMAQYQAFEKPEVALPLMGKYINYYFKIPYLNTTAWALILYSVFGRRASQRSTDTAYITEQNHDGIS